MISNSSDLNLWEPYTIQAMRYYHLDFQQVFIDKKLFVVILAKYVSPNSRNINFFVTKEIDSLH